MGSPCPSSRTDSSTGGSVKYSFHKGNRNSACRSTFRKLIIGPLIITTSMSFLLELREHLGMLWQQNIWENSLYISTKENSFRAKNLAWNKHCFWVDRKSNWTVSGYDQNMCLSYFCWIFWPWICCSSLVFLSFCRLQQHVHKCKRPMVKMQMRAFCTPTQQRLFYFSPFVCRAFLSQQKGTSVVFV